MITIELNGVKYKPVPSKSNDKICKDCDYFLDNGKCTLSVCPVDELDTEDTMFILEKI